MEVAEVMAEVIEDFARKRASCVSRAGRQLLPSSGCRSSGSSFGTESKAFPLESPCVERVAWRFWRPRLFVPLHEV